MRGSGVIQDFLASIAELERLDEVTTVARDVVREQALELARENEYLQHQLTRSCGDTEVSEAPAPRLVFEACHGSPPTTSGLTYDEEQCANAIADETAASAVAAIMGPVDQHVSVPEETEAWLEGVFPDEDEEDGEETATGDLAARLSLEAASPSSKSDDSGDVLGNQHSLGEVMQPSDKRQDGPDEELVSPRSSSPGSKVDTQQRRDQFVNKRPSSLLALPPGAAAGSNSNSSLGSTGGRPLVNGGSSSSSVGRLDSSKDKQKALPVLCESTAHEDHDEFDINELVNSQKVTWADADAGKSFGRRRESTLSSASNSRRVSSVLPTMEEQDKLRLQLQEMAAAAEKAKANNSVKSLRNGSSAEDAASMRRDGRLGTCPAAPGDRRRRESSMMMDPSAALGLRSRLDRGSIFSDEESSWRGEKRPSLLTRMMESQAAFGVAEALARDMVNASPAPDMMLQNCTRRSLLRSQTVPSQDPAQMMQLAQTLQLQPLEAASNHRHNSVMVGSSVPMAVVPQQRGSCPNVDIGNYSILVHGAQALQQGGEAPAVPLRSSLRASSSSLGQGASSAPKRCNLDGAEAVETIEITGNGGIDEEEEEEQIQMLPIWKTKKKGRMSSRAAERFSNKNRSSTTLDEKTIDIEEDECCCIFSYLGRFVANPSSSRRLMWDVLGLLFITFDLIVIPMQAFPFPELPAMSGVAVCATVFWTCDMPLSFFVGYHSEGKVEMRLDRIAVHYFRTWFPFDALVIAIDWTLFVTSSSDEQIQTSMGYARFGKFVKFLRLLRLLRLFKAQGVASDILDRIQSEYALIMVGIGKLLLFIMLINHLIACAWYFVGTTEAFSRQWIDVFIPEDDFTYHYATSLHWSISQFTPASMEVAPVNSLERIFTVCIILFAMVTFSSFVSTITNAMTQLRNLDRERNEQHAILRRYFVENRISAQLIGRISNCITKAIGKSKRRVHEQDIVMLQLLPWNLKTELQEEVYTPILSVHPFFKSCTELMTAQMKKVYQNALQELSVGIGQEIFNSGEASDRLFFVVTGILSYKEEGGMEHFSMISQGNWLCEPVIWISWKHAGQLIATTHCELIGLKAQKLQEVFTHGLPREQQECVKKYARLFVRYCKRQPDSLSDIWADVEVLAELSHKAFYEDDDEEKSEQPGSSSSNNLDAQLPTLKGQGSFGNFSALGLLGGNRRPSMSMLPGAQKVTPVMASDYADSSDSDSDSDSSDDSSSGDGESVSSTKSKESRCSRFSKSASVRGSDVRNIDSFVKSQKS